MHVHVAGGTNAGWKRLKAQAKTPWDCPKCLARNRFYWARCPNCGHKRPE